MAPSFNVGKPLKSLVRIPGSGQNQSLKAVCISISQIVNFNFSQNIPSLQSSPVPLQQGRVGVRNNFQRSYTTSDTGDNCVDAKLKSGTKKRPLDDKEETDSKRMRTKPTPLKTSPDPSPDSSGDESSRDELSLAVSIAEKSEFLVKMEEQYQKLLKENAELKQRLLSKLSVPMKLVV